MNERRDLWWPSPTVDLGQVIEVEPPGGFAMVHGATLERMQFSYESWGELNAEGDNAVLVVHPLASDPHATGPGRRRTLLNVFQPTKVELQSCLL